MSEPRSWIGFNNPQLSVREQCRRLGLHRNNVYYESVPESDETLKLMRMMDEEHLRRPYRGSRQMVDFLGHQGTKVNRKRILRLMQKMGICKRRWKSVALGGRKVQRSGCGRSSWERGWRLETGVIEAFRAL